MKKVLSLVLAFAMILGSFGFVFAGQYSDVSDTAYYSEPVSVLSGLGVVNGVGDGKFNPEGNVTRAQMAVMIVNCLGITVSSKADTGFTDVPASNPYSGWIKYAANLGIIAGYGDGKFGPDDPVTYDQALTMIIASLGYTSEGLGGTWPGNFINQARALGILSTCKTTGSAPASRADICCFLYDALETPMGKTNKDGEFVPTVVGTSGFGLFTTQEYDNILHRLEAHVLADMSGNPREIVVTPEVMADSAVDLSDYLGALITVLVNKDETEIVAVKEVLSTFVEGTWDEIHDKYTKGVAGNDAYIIMNGDYCNYDDFYVSYIKNCPFTLKLAAAVNGKEIEEVYSIQFWSPDTTFRASKADVEEFEDNETLRSYYFAKDDDKKIVETSYTIVGRDSVADIAADDIVTVYLHTDDAPDDSYKTGDIAKIEVGTETVEGKITKIDKDGLAYIGGKAYAPALFTTLTLSTIMNHKDEGTFFLDYAGDLFDFEKAGGDQPTKDFGVVLKTYGVTANTGEEKAMITMLLADGTTKDFEVAGVTITGKPYVWSGTAPAAGTIAEFKLDKDGIMAYPFEDEEVVTASSTWDISSNGKLVHSSTVFNADSVIFRAKGTDYGKASNYEIISMADVAGKKDVEMYYLSDGYEITIAVVKAAHAAATDLALFLEKVGDTADGEIWSVLYGDKLMEITVDFDPTSPNYVFSDPANVELVELSFDGDVASYEGHESVSLTHVDNTTAAITVSGKNVTLGNGAHAELADDVLVYVCNNNVWSVGTANSMAGKWTSSRPVDVFCHWNTSTDVIDFVIVIK